MTNESQCKNAVTIIDCNFFMMKDSFWGVKLLWGGVIYRGCFINEVREYLTNNFLNTEIAHS